MAWNVSEASAHLHRDAVVRDMTLEPYHANPDKYPKGCKPPPWQSRRPEQLPDGEDEVRGILGGNRLHVFRQVWM